VRCVAHGEVLTRRGPRASGGGVHLSAVPGCERCIMND